ncbi:MAG: H-NS histone family protein [Burkholderiales bacterium]|nr:H-NS histone family protein [Burkholderiales bacterium]MDE2396188.1 H-NS histone family protein [Burkholderiales bacterium]MDE2455081.1 H-NS histone family protein [Burkholderiales bacterium]
MQAELSAKSKEVVLRQVRQLMEFWSITPQELEQAWREGPDPVPGPTDAGAGAAVKYRHPLSGLTWDGCGAHPDWLRHALLQEGYTVAEMRPENQPGAAPAAEPPPPGGGD